MLNEFFATLPKGARLSKEEIPLAQALKEQIIKLENIILIDPLPSPLAENANRLFTEAAALLGNFGQTPHKYIEDRVKNMADYITVFLSQVSAYQLNLIEGTEAVPDTEISQSASLLQALVNFFTQLKKVFEVLLKALSMHNSNDDGYKLEP